MDADSCLKLTHTVPLLFRFGKAVERSRGTQIEHDTVCLWGFFRLLKQRYEDVFWGPWAEM